jgi:hypothetical protein
VINLQGYPNFQFHANYPMPIQPNPAVRAAYQSMGAGAEVLDRLLDRDR